MEYNKLLGRVRPQGVEQRSHSSVPCQSNSPPLLHARNTYMLLHDAVVLDLVHLRELICKVR